MEKYEIPRNESRWIYFYSDWPIKDYRITLHSYYTEYIDILFLGHLERNVFSLRQLAWS